MTEDKKNFAELFNPKAQDQTNSDETSDTHHDILKARKRDDSGCSAFLRILFCKCKPISNFKAIFERKPSALTPLDGIRALAVLWVYGLHVGYLWGGYMACFTLLPQNYWLVLFTKGDLGVDMFFVLSGFLIAFILLKECDKYGKWLDVFNFYRGRFLRIWPMMAICQTVMVTNTDMSM